jgi:hypothetical protein
MTDQTAPLDWGSNTLQDLGYRLRSRRVFAYIYIIKNIDV